MRALSVLALAVFMAGPGLRAECLLLCVQPDQPAARSSCHDEPVDGDNAAIGVHHDCAAIAPAVITAVKRAGVGSAVCLSEAAAADHIVHETAPPDHRWHDPPRFAPSATHPIPLRI